MNLNTDKDQSPITLSAILPDYKELVSRYTTYLDILGSAIESVERTENLQDRLRSLQREDYAEHLPETARMKEFEALLARAKLVDHSTHIFSLEDITPVRQLVSEDLGEGEPDDLFEKLCLIERIMGRNSPVFGGLRAEAAIPVSELLSFSDNTLTVLTREQFERCLNLVEAAIAAARTEAEKKLLDRESSISNCGTALLEEIGKQPALVLQLNEQHEVVRSALSAFNSWALNGYSSTKTHGEPISPTSGADSISSYLTWRYRVLGDLDSAVRSGDILSASSLNRSLEDKLGNRSGVNHFDAFIIDRTNNLRFQVSSYIFEKVVRVAILPRIIRWIYINNVALNLLYKLI